MKKKYLILAGLSILAVTFISLQKKHFTLTKEGVQLSPGNRVKREERPQSFSISKRNASAARANQIITDKSVPLVPFSKVSVGYCPEITKIRQGVVVQVNSERRVTRAQYLNPEKNEKPPDEIFKCIMHVADQNITEFVTVLPVVAKK